MDQLDSRTNESGSRSRNSEKSFRQSKKKVRKLFFEKNENFLFEVLSKSFSFDDSRWKYRFLLQRPFLFADREETLREPPIGFTSGRDAFSKLERNDRFLSRSNSLVKRMKIGGKKRR